MLEEIERSKGHGLSSNMTVGFPIDVGTDDEEFAGHVPDGAPGGAENSHGPSANIGASQSADNVFKQSQQHGKNTERSSSKINDNENSKKRKRNTEDDNGTTLKDLVAVIKQFAEMSDKRMGTLIDTFGERGKSEMRARTFEILKSPSFELYPIEQRIKAATGITGDIKRVDVFLQMGEFERQTMVWMIINDTFPTI